MDRETKMSRAAFLKVVGSGAAALVVGRLVGMLGSTTDISFLKDIDAVHYGTSTYGGTKRS